MKKTTKRNHKRKGFTLVELIAVMAILGILALLVIPRFSEMTEGSKVSVFQSTARTLASNVGLWSANHKGQIPTTTADLDEIIDIMPTDWAKRLDATNVMAAELDSKELVVTWESPSTEKEYEYRYHMEDSTSKFLIDGIEQTP